MNKTIKSLLIAALALSAQNLSANTTNQTFLQPRNQALVNLPLEQTTFAERVSAKLEDRFGGHFQITGFYGDSTNKSGIGSYFGVNNTGTFDMGYEGHAQAQTAAGVTPSPIATVDAFYLVHDSAGATDASTVANGMTVKLAPESVHYGVDLVYHQDLSKIVNGLYLKVNLPVQCVENNPNLTVNFIAAHAAAAILTSATPILSFFAGTYSKGVNDVNSQAALTKGLINGKQSATGVADIDLLVGYNFLKKETYHAGINIGLSIPTGNETTGKYLFEPVYGTKHFGLGAGLEAGARVWGDEDHNFKINFAANYRYLFQASETRTPGLTGVPASADKNWAQYYGLIQIGDNNGVTLAAVRQVIPAANLLTTNFDVTPGSQLDGILGLAYNKGGFNVDLGYNMYFREAESLKMKTNPFASTTTIYGVITRNSTVNNGSAVGGAAAIGVEGETAYTLAGAQAAALNAANVNIAAAATPSQFTNSIYAGLGYAFKDWEYPLMLGVGGKYEFASTNSALEVWQAHIKAGVSF